MAKFLFTVWPFAGHLHPAISVAHSLCARGHQVAFYTGGSVRSLVEGEGFRFFPFQSVDEKRVQSLVSSEFGFNSNLLSRLRRVKNLKKNFREWLLDTIPQQIQDIETALVKWQADVVVCDLAFWSPILVLSETRKIPVTVLSISAACMLPGPHSPAWGQGWPKPRNRISRLRARYERALFKWFSADFRSQVNSLRHRYGLTALHCSVTEFAGQMPLYLVPSTPEFDYERGDLPSSVHYVGPCLWDKPSYSAPPEWLSTLADDVPLIYVTEATIGTQQSFLLHAAALALRDQPVQVVMTTGKQRQSTELNGDMRAPNIRIEAYVPQSYLLPRVAVMVTLGGSGGVIAALKAGVPLVVVPNEWDRPENAQRVVEAGAGLRLAPGKCTPERLRHAVNRLLVEPSFRQNAQRLARAFASYGGPGQAAELLETLG